MLTPCPPGYCPRDPPCSRLDAGGIEPDAALCRSELLLVCFAAAIASDDPGASPSAEYLPTASGKNACRYGSAIVRVAARACVRRAGRAGVTQPSASLHVRRRGAAQSGWSLCAHHRSMHPADSVLRVRPDDRAAAEPGRTTVEIVVPVHNEACGLGLAIRRVHAYLTDHLPFPSRITIAETAALTLPGCAPANWKTNSHWCVRSRSGSRDEALVSGHNDVAIGTPWAGARGWSAALVARSSRAVTTCCCTRSSAPASPTLSAVSMRSA